MSINFDASFIYYLIELFEGKISYTEINNMNLNLLLAMKKFREDQLEEIKRKSRNL